MAIAERIGQLLLRANVITEEQLQKAIEVQKQQRGRLGSHLIKLGFISEKDLLYFLSRQYGVPTIELRDIEIPAEAIKILPAELVKKYNCMPINLQGNLLVVGMIDPSNVFAIDDIKFLTGFAVETGVITESDFERAFKKYYENPSETNMQIDAKDYTFEEEKLTAGMDEEYDDSIDKNVIDLTNFDTIVKGALDTIEVLEDGDDESLDAMDSQAAPIIKLVNGLLVRAIKMGVSDIHIEPYEKQFRVRYRIDGSLRKIMSLPVKMKNAIISRLKIMSRLDIAERRLPQDGRIKLKLGKVRDVDFRVSVLPTLFGEKVVLRLLDKSNLQVDMTNLGFEPDALQKFKETITSPYGMLLVTGPTGSGKTTTLYSALSTVNQEDVNIMTAEDPVEFNFLGINQVQMRENIGLNFAAALRSFLRQDPDVIMVGEIRDYETAEIGIKAALTGHLVFSTLHTNDAPSTVNRLLNMGIEPFLVSSAVLLIVAQRLARRICPKCKERVQLNEKVLQGIGFTEEDIAKGFVIYKAKGCPECAGTGYKGRVALYEVMKITDNIKDLIMNHATAMEIKAMARKDGMKTLREAGLTKIKEGVTTIEEVIGVTMADR
ncbi:MAG: type IV-A pilus assembly ATPase PilB [bacterium]